MADILIKGMEMPKSCKVCPLGEYWEANPWTYGHRCFYTKKDIDANVKGKTIHTDCPLVEVPDSFRKRLVTEYDYPIGG